MSADIRQDIDKIMRKLIVKSGSKFLSSHDTLYYKIDGKIYYKFMKDDCYGATKLDVEACALKKLIRKMRQLAIANPEYTLYVGDIEDVYLDYKIYSCVNRGLVYSDPVAPLIPEELQPKFATNAIITRIVFDKDPLTQVLEYATLKLVSQSISNSYVCPQMYYVKYSGGDLSYLFMVTANFGLVAYCTTFRNYISGITDGQWDSLNKQLGSIWSRVNEKLEDYKKQISSLSKEKRKRQKSCDVNTIKDLVSKEIEEVDELMKRYGIIRITIPLG